VGLYKENIAKARLKSIGASRQRVRVVLKTMWKLIFAPLVLLLVIAEVAAQSGQADQTGWEEFAPEGGGFSILFPTKPVEAIQKKTNYTLHSFTSVAGRGTYIASYADYQQIKTEPAAFLIANRDRFIKSMQATLGSSREITLNGHTGLEFTAEHPAAYIKSQIFLVGNRLFQTATMIFKDVDQTTYVNRFFESFKLSHKKAQEAQKAQEPRIR
jgi:hypothetical protein